MLEVIPQFTKQQKLMNISYKNYLPITSHYGIYEVDYKKRATRFCELNVVIPFLKLNNILKFRVFYFVFTNLNIIKTVAIVFMIFKLQLVNALAFVIITCVYFLYNTRVNDARLEFTLLTLVILLLSMEALSIVVPLGILVLIPLITYNSQFELTLILNANFFRIVFLSLYAMLALLVTFILCSNLEIIASDIVMMKKGTLDTLKALSTKIDPSKVKVPKPDPGPHNNGGILVENEDQPSEKVGYYSTERNTFPRICRLSALSSSTFDTLDENVRRSITKNLYAEVEVILDKKPTKSDFLASPRFNQQALNLFELAKSQGPDSPVAKTATKKLAETYCFELSTQSMDLNLVKSKVKNIVNGSPVYHGLLLKNPNLFINCQLVESLTPKNLNQLLNISNTYSSVWKNYPQPNILENMTCSRTHNVYLEERFSVKGFSVFSLNKNYSSFSHPQNCWNFLTSLNSNFDKEVLKAYNEYINYIRTVDNDRLQINNEKGLFKKAINFAIPFVSGQTFALVSEEQQKNIVDYSINPRTPYNLIDLAVKGEEITWENLSLLETHNYLLDIPTLGVLQNDLNNYFLSRNIDHLIHCLVKVKENPANFIIQQDADQSTNTTPVNPKWEGKKTIQQCSDGESMHFKHVNIFGLHVLSQACIFEANSCFIDNHPSKLEFMNEILSNKVITHKLSTDPFFTQGIKVETLTKF